MHASENRRAKPREREREAANTRDKCPRCLDGGPVLPRDARPRP